LFRRDNDDEGQCVSVREAAPRRTFPFDARAEVTPENSRTVSARVRELSLHGCFLEFPTSLAAGTRVFVKMVTKSEFFEAKGSVIYSRPNVGFGLAFLEVEPRFLRVLQEWLTLAKEKIESGYNENPIDGLNERE
jgi:hypothetical protein